MEGEGRLLNLISESELSYHVEKWFCNRGIVHRDAVLAYLENITSIHLFDRIVTHKMSLSRENFEDTKQSIIAELLERLERDKFSNEKTIMKYWDKIIDSEIKKHLRIYRIFNIKRKEFKDNIHDSKLVADAIYWIDDVTATKLITHLQSYRAIIYFKPVSLLKTPIIEIVSILKSGLIYREIGGEIKLSGSNYLEIENEDLKDISRKYYLNIEIIRFLAYFYKIDMQHYLKEYISHGTKCATSPERQSYNRGKEERNPAVDYEHR